MNIKHLLIGCRCGKSPAPRRSMTLTSRISQPRIIFNTAPLSDFALARKMPRDLKQKKATRARMVISFKWRNPRQLVYRRQLWLIDDVAVPKAAMVRTDVAKVVQATQPRSEHSTILQPIAARDGILFGLAHSIVKGRECAEVPSFAFLPFVVETPWNRLIGSAPKIECTYHPRQNARTSSWVSAMSIAGSESMFSSASTIAWNIDSAAGERLRPFFFTT